MKVLWVKAGKLIPVDTGGKIRTYNILYRLAKQFEITLLSYYDGPQDPAYEAALLEQFPQAQLIPTGVLDAGGFPSVLRYARQLPRRAPYSVSKFTHRKVRKAVADALSSGRFDLLICDFLAVSLNFPDSPRVPCILFQHNVESVLWERMAATESNPLRKLAYMYEAARMLPYECQALSRFHYVLAVSEQDRQQMLKMQPQCKITVIRTGVDVRATSPSPPSSITPPRIVFSGSMDWEPNVDAVEYFCIQILPQILSVFPDAIFQIVGRNPLARVKCLASKSVQVTGTVPSVTEYLRNATIVVVPLRIGSGTRLKIYEAMALGKALISTSIGAEGLDFQNGRDLLLADDSSSFAKAILMLLREGEIRRKFELAARQLVAQYDWSDVVRTFGEVLGNIVSGSVLSETDNQTALG